MISRYSWKWEAPLLKETPIKIEYELKEKIIPISFNEDNSVKEYKKEEVYVEKKSKWKDYIKSFDLGSPTEQVLRHLKTGEPLVTGHVLPHGDYTPQSILKGADIVRQMKANGVTLEMIESALKSNSGTTKEGTTKEGTSESDGE